MAIYYTLSPGIFEYFGHSGGAGKGKRELEIQSSLCFYDLMAKNVVRLTIGGRLGF